ncbi:alcohol dehydrogenase [Grosmannia clavigera kw1407]|uniref:alcohol dehydrogenase n=1 Tax=Grosmannia clavigera (strain kw1407 / UAMH 11150) TaxID=655863 RepID=F0XBE6_GROCL|nr:alcohol dehydrogenase [Grosmannia clavigera kw1407]EFX04980.1 alcohol dehydrogenase [Grosmannia clavigera kw1407]
MPSATSAIPATQRAAVKEGHGASAKTPLREVAVPQPGPDEILVKLTWTGLCASDKSLLHDEWGGVGLAMTPDTHGIAGHEGVGRVVAMGPGVEAAGRWKLGDRAGIKWIASVCGHCVFCRDSYQGGEVLCLHQKNSGFSVAGTFQQYCVTSAAYATVLPDAVSDEEAGPIMCGGVTAYSACKRSQVRPGQWIVLLGAGGGLGHLGLQYAKAMGMRIIAVDGGAAKREICLRMGAEIFLDFADTPDMPAAVLALTDGIGAHGVINFAAAPSGYATAPYLLRSNGTLVAVGMPGDPAVLAGAPPMMLAIKRLNIVGSAVGTLADVDEALDFTARGLVHPILTKGTLADVDRLMDDMVSGKLAGRAVLKIED